MREIKFRVWDKWFNKYFTNTTEAYKGHLEVLSIGMNGRIQLRYTDKTVDESMFPNRFVIEQYTGLKDKNGVEIYEGDLVNFEYDTSTLYSICGSTPKGNVENRVSIVKYGTTEYVFSGIYENGIKKDSGGYIPINNIATSYINGDCQNMEVIGNIHEGEFNE